MVRSFQNSRDESRGTLIVDSKSSEDKVLVYFKPSDYLYLEWRIELDSANNHVTKIIELDMTERVVSIFPINTTNSNQHFLGPKYDQIRKISLANASNVVSPNFADSESTDDFVNTLSFGETTDWDIEIDDEEIETLIHSPNEIIQILESLPPGFTKDYEFGLGFARPYKCIVDVLEELTNCTTIVITNECESQLGKEDTTFYLNNDDYRQIIKWVNSTNYLKNVAENEVKRVEVHNFYASILGLPLTNVNTGRHPKRKFFTKLFSSRFDKIGVSDEHAITKAMIDNISNISKNHTDEIIRLKTKIETATLENFINEMGSQLGKGLKEKHWQRFFKMNPLILSLTLGNPYVVIGEQAWLGGTNISGGGAKITDFIMKSTLTGNVAIVEIKSPETPLIADTEYRKNVFPPTRQLSGAILQLLDQKDGYKTNYYSIKANSEPIDIERYSVQCVLIAGRLPCKEKLKSFELYRSSVSYIQIVTYDELLAKMKLLLQLLNESNTDRFPSNEIEPPF